MTSWLYGLNIKTRVTLLATCAIAVIAIAVGASLLSLDRSRIGGATYRQIADGRDLIAEVVPPRLLIIEAYLVAQELAAEVDDGARAQGFDRVRKLRRDFEASQSAWRVRLPDGANRRRRERPAAVGAQPGNLSRRPLAALRANREGYEQYHAGGELSLERWGWRSQPHSRQ